MYFLYDIFIGTAFLCDNTISNLIFINNISVRYMNTNGIYLYILLVIRPISELETLIIEHFYALVLLVMDYML